MFSWTLSTKISPKVSEHISLNHFLLLVRNNPKKRKKKALKNKINLASPQKFWFHPKWWRHQTESTCGQRFHSWIHVVNFQILNIIWQLQISGKHTSSLIFARDTRSFLARVILHRWIVSRDGHYQLSRVAKISNSPWLFLSCRSSRSSLLE